MTSVDGHLFGTNGRLELTVDGCIDEAELSESALWASHEGRSLTSRRTQPIMPQLLLMGGRTTGPCDKIEVPSSY